MRRKIVCFSGIDCSGKSTHIALLTAKLSPSSNKYKYIWFRYPKFFSFLILGLCRVLGITKVVKGPNGRKTWKTHFYANKAVRKLWPYFQLIDTVLYWVNKVCVSSVLGCVIILDRSPVDTLVDVAYDVRNEKMICGTIGKLFINIILTYSLSVILDTKEEVAMCRKDDVCDIRQLKMKRKLYTMLGKIYGLHIVDTTRPISEVHAEVMRSVGIFLAS